MTGDCLRRSGRVGVAVVELGVRLNKNKINRELSVSIETCRAIALKFPSGNIVLKDRQTLPRSSTLASALSLTPCNSNHYM